MLLIESDVFGKSFVQIACREIKIGQHAVAVGIIRKVEFCPPRNLFRFGSLALRQVQTGKSNPWLRTLLIDINRLLELLLRFWVLSAGLVISAQKDSALQCLG